MMNINATSTDDFVFTPPLGAKGLKAALRGYIQAAQQNTDLIRLPRARCKGRRFADAVLALVGRGSVYMAQKRYIDFKYTR